MKSPRQILHSGNVLVILGAAAMVALTPVDAQVAQPVTAEETPQQQGNETAGLSVQAIEVRLSAVEQDSALQDAEKEVLISKYREALQFLGQAEAHRALALEYGEAAQSAPRQAAEFARQLEELPSLQEAADSESTGTADQLVKEADLRRASLVDLDGQIESVESELSAIAQRPAEIDFRLPKAEEELKAEETALGLLGEAEADAPSREAERLRLQAKQSALMAEVEMLREERSSQSARETRLTAQRNLLLQRRDNERAALTALDEVLKQQRLTEAERVSQQLAQLVSQIENPSDDAVKLIAELESLAIDLQGVTGKIEALDGEYEKLSTRFNLASNTSRRIQERAKLGGLAGTFGQTLIAQYRTLGSPRELELTIKARQQTLREVRIANFRIEEALTEQDLWQERLRGNGSDAEQRLLSTRLDVLEKLQGRYQDQIDALVRFDSKIRDLRDLILEFREFLNENVFWIRSSPPAGTAVVRDLPGSLTWFFSADHGTKVVRSLAGIPQRHPFLGALVAVLLVVLLAARRRIAANVTARGKQTRRISWDHYSHTLASLGGTLLLTVPVPLTLAFAGWSFVRDPAGAGWLHGLGLGLLWAAGFYGFVSFLRCCCRPGGLANPHFKWAETTASQLRSNLLTLFVPYVALLMVTSSTLYAIEPQHLGSLGRLCFVLAQGWLAVGLWRLLRPSNGLFAKFLVDRPKAVLARSRYLWLTLTVGAPLATAGLALAGYVLTAFALNAVFLGSIALIAAGVVFYALVLRWFMIKERKMAYAEALEERRARREAERSSETESEESIVVEEVEMELDLDDVGTQTRRLLSSLTSVVVIVLLWWYWERALPMAEFLGNQAVGSGISFLGVAQALLVITVTLTVVRNLPGLLDLAGLRDSGIDAGTRFAVATICQYALGAVALGLLAGILDLDWAQFGWIAAALSVGLGFGLQEVVANFVCGIILLFERPIRLGDVVTVDGVSGTVSRIKMRATTITNWDRQDYIVPNKQLITGSLVNWTLLNPINRVVIPVGVAYGSDTGKAMQLLREVAEDHPIIMDDPAPLISFESFGDSTLDLMLRCYLPNMDNRMKTITELHSEIDRRFKEAGIEIAFPQRDLHIRSMGPEVSQMTEANRDRSTSGNFGEFNVRGGRV